MLFGSGCMATTPGRSCRLSSSTIACDNNADERFFYHLVDDYDGWQQFTIPFGYFQRRSDWQPSGAPDDGFNLNAVWGLFGFPGGVGAQTAYFDQVEVVVVDDPNLLTMVTEVEVDQSIGWDSRQWDLLWSDEFDAAAGTPINDASWTCSADTAGANWSIIATASTMSHMTVRVIG